MNIATLHQPEKSEIMERSLEQHYAPTPGVLLSMRLDNPAPEKAILSSALSPNSNSDYHRHAKAPDLLAPQFVNADTESVSWQLPQSTASTSNNN
uniref:ARAD1D01804p n=1 Tax=Blastobotrys adeninivorans TaxID=409370 RepID=A0A060T7A7_BLAAD